MLEVIAAFLGTEALQALAEQGPERLDGAAAGSSDDRFQLGKAELDRIEVGTIRWQIPDGRVGAGEGAADAGDFVDAEIVGNDDVARAEGGHKNLVEVGEETRPINGAIKDPWGGEARDTERGEKRTGLPPGAGRVVVDAHAACGAPISPQEVVGNAGFIEKREPFGVPTRGGRAPGGTGNDHVRAIVFGRPHRFF